MDEILSFTAPKNLMTSFQSNEIYLGFFNLFYVEFQDKIILVIHYTHTAIHSDF